MVPNGHATRKSNTNFPTRRVLRARKHAGTIGASVRCRNLGGLVVVVGVLLFSVSSSGQNALESHLKASTNPHIRGYAGVLSTAVWDSRAIFVCWENPTEQDAADRESVREAIASTWQRHSALSFKGWQPCAAINKGIRIRIEDSGAHTKGLGKQLDGKKNGMVLNFTFQKWNVNCQQKRAYCVKVIAVHEFGHALGFSHEQNRFDAPGECALQAQGPNPDRLLTPYDPISVMNYCNEKYSNDGELSTLDVAAVQFLYGSPAEPRVP
jgi:hypothetical protein